MRKNRNRPESDEPLSEGRVEYLEAARQRVRNRRIRRTAVLLVLLTAVVLFATGIAGSSVAALKDLTDTARIKGVEVPKSEIAVTDEEVDAEVKKEQDKNAF